MELEIIFNGQFNDKSFYRGLRKCKSKQDLLNYSDELYSYSMELINNYEITNDSKMAEEISLKCSLFQKRIEYRIKNVLFHCILKFNYIIFNFFNYINDLIFRFNNQKNIYSYEEDQKPEKNIINTSFETIADLAIRNSLEICKKSKLRKLKVRPKYMQSKNYKDDETYPESQREFFTRYIAVNGDNNCKPKLGTLLRARVHTNAFVEDAGVVNFEIPKGTLIKTIKLEGNHSESNLYVIIETNTSEPQRKVDGIVFARADVCMPDEFEIVV